MLFEYQLTQCINQTNSTDFVPSERCPIQLPGSRVGEYYKVAGFGGKCLFGVVPIIGILAQLDVIILYTCEMLHQGACFVHGIATCQWTLICYGLERCNFSIRDLIRGHQVEHDIIDGFVVGCWLLVGRYGIVELPQVLYLQLACCAYSTYIVHILILLICKLLCLCVVLLIVNLGPT